MSVVSESMPSDNYAFSSALFPSSMPPATPHDAQRLLGPTTPTPTPEGFVAARVTAPTATLEQNPLSGALPTSDPAWAKRANRACCPCRRDKIRCDGSWPCTACVRKGLPGECIEGCLSCRRARVLCDGGKPCGRCAETAQECVDETAAIKPQISATLTKPAERAKLACMACRRDNKKCDDNRPCLRCRSRQEECIHVIRGPKVVKQRCLVCRKDNKRCEDQRPCSYCSEGDQECTDVPRKGGGQGSRVKKACISCRRNKVQCGEERPCRVCLRRGLECIDRVCVCADKGQTDCEICRPHKALSKIQTSEQAYETDGPFEGQPDSPGTTTSSSPIVLAEQDHVESHSYASSQRTRFHDDMHEDNSTQAYMPNAIRFRTTSTMNIEGMESQQSNGYSAVADSRASGVRSQANSTLAFPSLPDSEISPGVGVGVGVGVYDPWTHSSFDQLRGQSHRPASMTMPVSMPYSIRMQSSHSSHQQLQPQNLHLYNSRSSHQPTLAFSPLTSGAMSPGVGSGAYSSGNANDDQRVQRSAQTEYLPSPPHQPHSPQQHQKSQAHHPYGSNRTRHTRDLPPINSAMPGAGVSEYDPEHAGNNQLPGRAHRPASMAYPSPPPISPQEQSQPQVGPLYLAHRTHQHNQSHERDGSPSSVRNGDFWTGQGQTQVHSPAWDPYFPSDIDPNISGAGLRAPIYSRDQK